MRFYNCYITDKRLEKFLLKINNQLLENRGYYDDGFLDPKNHAMKVVKFTDGTYGVQDYRVNMLYDVPIKESQFKRTSVPYLFKCPEGKSGLYTIKKRNWITGFDEHGNEIVRDGVAYLYGISSSYSVAFNNAQFLKELKFEDGVTATFPTIFNDRYSENPIDIGIERITIPASLVSIGDWQLASEGYYGMFSELTNLKEYNVDGNNPVFKSVDGALLSKDGKILYSMPCGIGKDYIVPDGVELIASAAFANAQNMTITIPASVKYFDAYSIEGYENGRHRAAWIFSYSSDITLNVSSKTTIRDVFESLPDGCERLNTCDNLTVNFVD